MIKDVAGRCISYLFWAGFGPCQLSYRERSQTAGHLGHLLPPLILPLPESLHFRKSFHSLGSWYEEQDPELGVPDMSPSTISNEQELKALHFAQG